MKVKAVKILTLVMALCVVLSVFTACGESQHEHKCSYNSFKSDNIKHWYECICGNKRNIEYHFGGVATCTKKAVCGNCNTEFGELEPHRYSSKYSFDKTHHWFEATCGCVLEPVKEAHTTGGDICPTCEFPFNPTEGVTYDLSADGTYAEVVGYTGSATKVKIADTYQGKPVTSIYNNAFKDTYITYIEIPNSVTSIGDSAFYNCDSLTSVEIPNGVIRIGGGAFSDCASLTSVVIGDSVTNIDDFAFSDCVSLTSIGIPNSVTSIGRSAFSNCASLTSVELGDSVTNIGEYAFGSCNNLQFNEYENCKYLGSKDNPYFALVEVTNKNFTTYTIHNNTKIIADGTFRKCSRLYSIEIPNSVTSIGYEAFYDCDSLTSVVIGDSVTSIGYEAFRYCSSLTSVVIGDSVTSIGNSAFSNCDSLTEENVTVKDPNGWQYKIYSGEWIDLSPGKVAEYIKSAYYELRKI